jgi:hypothetical protein
MTTTEKAKSTQIRKEMIAHWHSFKNPLINDILINLEKLEKKLNLYRKTMRLPLILFSKPVKKFHPTKLMS